MQQSDAEPSKEAAILKLDKNDNIVVAKRRIEPGQQMLIDGQSITISAAIDLGHKIACRDIACGEKVIKYGAPIGSATAEIKLGDHVHAHNLQSDYVAFHAHDNGAAG